MAEHVDRSKSTLSSKVGIDFGSRISLKGPKSLEDPEVDAGVSARGSGRDEGGGRSWAPPVFLSDIKAALSAATLPRFPLAEVVSELKLDAEFGSGDTLNSFGHGIFNLPPLSDTTRSSKALEVAFEPLDDGANNSREGGIYSFE